MKKFIGRITAAALSAVMMLSAAGCSKAEQEHFDKSVGADRTGQAIVSSEVNYTVDPEAFIWAAVETGKKTMGDEYEEEEIDVADLLSDSRFLFDENKKLNVSVSALGTVDFDKNLSDASVYVSFNGITVECGKLYTRGDKAYYDKKLVYNMTALSSMFSDGLYSDADDLNSALTQLDAFFGDKQYLELGISDKASISSAKDMYLSYYDKGKVLLNGFDSGCVSRIENGTRFEMDNNKFTALTKGFANYLKANKKETADYLNSYIGDVLDMSARLSGAENDEIMSVADLFEIAPSDIAESADDTLELLGMDEYKAFMSVVDMHLVSDITEEDGVQNSETTFTLNGPEGSIIEMNAVQILEDASDIEFENISGGAVSYKDYMKLLEEINRPVYDDYDYDYDTEYDPDDYEDYDYDDETTTIDDFVSNALYGD